MSRRRRRSTGPPRCNTCGRRIVFKILVSSGNWATFNPKPVDGTTHVGGRAYPVEGSRAWRLDELVEELMVRLKVSEPEARREAYAYPFFVAHNCAAAAIVTAVESEEVP